ncbi:MAG TPA: phenylacetate--CoA ligase family protein [Elusimicrobia bacterium]|nr:phenylacetate--CoA ligase family protein [Elusimicrobiota bacterium]
MLSPDDVFAAAQDEIAYAYERMPFFRRHMEDAGVRPGDIGRPGDLPRIPPTDKTWYRKGFPGGVLTEGVTLSDPRLRHLSSSGTADERLLTVEWNALWVKRCLDACKVHPGIRRGLRAERHCYYIPASCAEASCAGPAAHAPHANPESAQDRGASAPADAGRPRPVAGGLMLPAFHDLLATDERMVDESLRALERFRPSLYMVSPAHLAFLARRMSERGFHPPAAPILATYSLCGILARRQILAAFPAETAFSEVVGMSELGFLAAECPRGGLHLNSEAFLCELRTGGRAAEPGELAELVVTTIDGGCSPHVRYRTGDAYRLVAKPCPCGHGSPLVRMEGRIRNLLMRKGRAVLTPRELDETVGDCDWLRLYKMEQTGEEAFSFSYIPAEGRADRAPELAQRLKERLGTDVRLSLRSVEYLPAARSGKFMECESRVAAEGLRL